MHNRALLEKRSQSIVRNDLTKFMRASSWKFRPEQSRQSQHIGSMSFIRNLQQLGRIDFEDERLLTRVAGEIDHKLISNSGKKKQYQIAQKVLGNNYEEESEDRGRPGFPDSIVGKNLSELIYHLNLVMPESFPLDVEMAGCIPKEWVTGGAESGSYYAPGLTHPTAQQIEKKSFMPSTMNCRVYELQPTREPVAIHECSLVFPE